jgi:hypothetical protein
MTSALGREKQELAALEALRHRLERVAVLEAEEQDAARRVEAAAAERAALSVEEDGTRTELGELNGSPAALALDERKAEADRLRERARVLEAAHRSQADGLITILRRAERLVAKRGDRQAAARLHHLQSDLAEPLSGDSAALGPRLSGGLAVVRDLIAAGEFAPKTDDPLFDDPDAVAAAVVSRADAHARIAEEASALERECATSPIAQDRERLAGRLRQLDHRAAVLEDEGAGLSRVAEQKAKERDALLAGLDEDVGTAFGGRVRLASPDA